MAFGTRQNNEKDNNISINTRGYQFSNKDGFDPSALTVGGWNDMLSIRINPALEPSKQTTERVFYYDRSVSTSLTIEKAAILLYRIENTIMPAIDAKEDKTIGIPTSGGETLLVVGTSTRGTDTSKPYIGIFKGIKEDTRKPEIGMFYEFKAAQTIDDYNESDGTFTITEVLPRVEFETFTELIKSFIANGSNFGTHSSRFVNRFRDSKLMELVNKIAVKLGVQTGGYSNSSSYNNSKNVFSNNNTSSNTFDSVDPEEIGDINDFMND